MRHLPKQLEWVNAMDLDVGGSHIGYVRYMTFAQFRRPHGDDMRVMHAGFTAPEIEPYD